MTCDPTYQLSHTEHLLCAWQHWAPYMFLILTTTSGGSNYKSCWPLNNVGPLTQPIFFSKYYGTTQPVVGWILRAEPWIWGPPVKLYLDFLTAQGSVLLTCAMFGGLGEDRTLARFRWQNQDSKSRPTTSRVQAFYYCIWEYTGWFYVLPRWNFYL